MPPEAILTSGHDGHAATALATTSPAAPTLGAANAVAAPGSAPSPTTPVLELINATSNHAGISVDQSAPFVDPDPGNNAQDHDGHALNSLSGPSLAPVFDVTNSATAPRDSSPLSLLTSLSDAAPEHGAAAAGQTTFLGSPETRSTTSAAAMTAETTSAPAGASAPAGVNAPAHSGNATQDVTGNATTLDAANKPAPANPGSIASLVESGTKAILLASPDRSAGDAGAGASLLAAARTGGASGPVIAAPSFTPELLSARDQLASAIATASPAAAAITTLPAQATPAATITTLGADTHALHSHGGL
jgi:hypothetical protein